MTVKNAMLNYAYNGAAEEAVSEPETTSPTEPETTQPETSEPEASESGNLVDERIVSESVDENEDYMRTQKTYDSNGNYVTSEIDEAGNTTTYTNDA